MLLSDNDLPWFDPDVLLQAGRVLLRASADREAFDPSLILLSDRTASVTLVSPAVRGG